MDTSTHSLRALFAQLGLADDCAAIEALAHRHFQGSMLRCDAPLWTAKALRRAEAA